MKPACPDSPNGQHRYSPDREYDAVNPPMNCEYCGQERPKLPATVRGDDEGIYVGDLKLVWQKGKYPNVAHLLKDESEVVFPAPLCDVYGSSGWETVEFVGDRVIKVCPKCRKLREPK